MLELDFKQSAHIRRGWGRLDLEPNVKEWLDNHNIKWRQGFDLIKGKYQLDLGSPKNEALFKLKWL